MNALSETEIKLSSITNLPDSNNIEDEDLFLVSLYLPSRTPSRYEYFSRKAKLKNFPMASDAKAGFMSSADYSKLKGIETGATKYILPKATAGILGGIKVGKGLEINDGVLSTEDIPEYELKPATKDKLGGLKVGYTENLNKFAVKIVSSAGDDKGRTYVEIPSFLRASANTASGLVTKPTSVTQTAYLRDDGSWATPPGTTYSRVNKQNDGLCPQLPRDEAGTKYLRGDGEWESMPSSTITFNDIYPVGSVYISVNKDLPAALSRHGSWQRIAIGKCLFGANDDGYYASKKVGEAVSPGITTPSIDCTYTVPTAKTTVSLSLLTTSSAGEHSHTYSLATSGAADCGETGWHPFQTYTNSNTSSSGSHSHSITGNATATTTLAGGSVKANVLKDDIYGKSNTVQPPALVVSMWKRIA